MVIRYRINEYMIRVLNLFIEPYLWYCFRMNGMVNKNEMRGKIRIAVFMASVYVIVFPPFFYILGVVLLLFILYH